MWRESPQASLIHGGRRLHLQHGPIDLLIQVDATSAVVQNAFQQASRAFAHVLESLVEELPLLRRLPESADALPLGVVARRMVYATRAVRQINPEMFVTPMASVAGAVADHILRTMIEHLRRCAQTARRIVVNNGGDIAWALADGEQLTTAMIELSDTTKPLSAFGQITLASENPARGMATSGWRGRSHSLGIADSVTVLAGCAAQADVAATLIANAVDLPGSVRISREPASALQPDSDLGDRLVTVGVAPLSAGDIAQAMAPAKVLARAWAAAGLIHSAVINLQGTTAVVGKLESLSQPIDVNTEACLVGIAD